MFKIIKAPPQHYGEEHQTNRVKFSFANKVGDEVKEIFSGVVCRDFLGDCLFSEETKTPIAIYGFSYDPEKNNIDRDKCRIIISGESELLTRIVENKSIIWILEDFHKIPRTDFSRVGKNNILIEADPKWLLTNYLISYYTYLIKVASYKYSDINDWKQELLKMDNKEASYLKLINKGFDKLTHNLFKISDPYHGVCGLPANCGTHAVHYNTGFVSLVTKPASITKYNAKFLSL